MSDKPQYSEPVAGQTYEVEYPFVRETVSLWDEQGPHEIESWRPGTRPEAIAPDDVEEVADAHGHMLMHVVDVHKPGRYPTRVFFTRRWRSPDGKEFGKAGLRIMTVPAFRRRLNGFMYPYRARHQ